LTKAHRRLKQPEKSKVDKLAYLILLKMLKVHSKKKRKVQIIPSLNQRCLS